VVRVDHDLVVHFRDTIHVPRELLRQFLVDVFRYGSRQRGLALAHRHRDVAGLQMWIQGVGRRDPGLQPGIVRGAGHRTFGEGAARGAQCERDARSDHQLPKFRVHSASPSSKRLWRTSIRRMAIAEEYEWDWDHALSSDAGRADPVWRNDRP
jgi:hypothetical protein